MEQIREVRWTKIAANEFEATIDWLLKNRSSAIAVNFRDDVWNKIQRLRKQPFIGRQSAMIQNCRQTIVLPYHIIIYKIFDEHIEVIRVFDARQNPNKLIIK